MKLQSIRSHLTTFSIIRKRKTTIAHAFASAIAPTESYSEQKVVRALQILGQSESNIMCVYCGDPAETWDHLVGLVKNSRFSGFGHVLGNLVPCCKICNSRKGNSDWEEYLRRVNSGESYQVRHDRLKRYQLEFSMPGLSYELIGNLAPSEIAEYERLHHEVLKLLTKADLVAEKIRRKLTDHSKDA